MVRAGAVVAQAFAGVGAEEDRAGMPQQRLPALRLARADLEVFGRDAVAELAGLFHRAREDQRAAPFERGADDVCARQARQQALDRRAHGIEVGGVGAQQQALRQFVVLGLREQVHRHPVGIGRARRP